MGHIRTPQADSDLDSIWYYVASRSGSVETADRLIDSITGRFVLLARYPNMGRARDEDLRPGLRSFSVGEYVIIYRVEEADVQILRVLRGSRNLESLLGRELPASAPVAHWPLPSKESSPLWHLCLQDIDPLGRFGLSPLFCYN